MTGTPGRGRRTGWLLLLLAVLLVWALDSGRIQIPPAWNPWTPLDIAAAPNLLTRFKLQRASADRETCRSVLAQTDLQVVAVPDRETGPGCGFDNVFRIDRSAVAVGAPFTLSCRAALSLALWERHVLQPAAREHLGQRVTRIEHLGSYACRNVYGLDDRRRSQHATADALDIAGFVLADGRRIRVLRDWPEAGVTDRSASSDFLVALRDGACRYFDAVLGPDYNQAHADHFHFDRGFARICR